MTSTMAAMRDAMNDQDRARESRPTLPTRKRGRWRRRVGWSLFGLVATVALVGVTFTRYAVHRAFPQVEGTIVLAGLASDVEVLRDSMGIPHIYADTPEDLFMAQGYVHAQDRFFQMDFWRHISSGELSSMFGESQLATDTFLRAMDWSGLAQAQYEAESPDHRALLDAYADGVNAYLDTQSPADLSFEYSILELLNHSYDPADWTGADSLAWGKVMSWDLGGNMRMEIERAVALATLPPERAKQLFPAYPGDRHPFITMVDAASTGGGTTTFVVPDGAVGALTSAASTVSLVDGVTLGGEGTGIGSNSWVVSGEHSPTGMPLLANDPHLGAQMPSIWYQVGLHCRSVDEDCPFDVAGFSFAGVPGVIIGHNDRIAWGFTNVSPDVQDLYIERLNPDNPTQYEVEGVWVDMETRTETIEVAGGDPVTVEIRSTRHGPIISDSFEPLEDFDRSGVFVPEPYAVALRWTGLDESPSLLGPILGLNTATGFAEFRAAAELFDVPSQNLIYADVDGNIGYQMPGKVPIRANGDGTLPAPGWTDDYEWTGFIPFDELPMVLNPDTGWIVTANNAVVDGSYPYLIAEDWAYGYRAKRIVDLLTSNLGIGTEGFATLQFDSHDLNAEHILPFLENALVVVPGIDLDQQDTDAINHLFRWDLQNFAGSTGAAIWNATWRNLLDLTFRGDVHEDYMPDGNGRWFEVIRQLLDRPDDPFWDDPSTTPIEDRDTILVLAFHAAVDELTEIISDDVDAWSWGDIHTMTFINQTLGDSGIGIIEDRFNRGPFPASGSDGVVNAVGWSTVEGYEVDWLPSMRMVVDLADLTRSTSIHTTGQSGHVDHPHYDDMIPLWLAGETLPMLWDRSDIVDDTESRLLLVP